MQPLYIAALTLLLSSGFAWAGDAARLASGTIPVRSATTEMKMIQLQSIVAQRQLAMQMMTQVLARMNQSQSSIARNIR